MTRVPSRPAFAWLWLALTWLAACGAHAPFASRFEQPADAWREVLAQARRAPTIAPRPVVLGVADAPRGVFAYDLAAERLLFREPADVVAVPVAAGNLAVVPERGHVLIRRLEGGAVVHELPSLGMHFVGASSDGRVTAVVLSSGGTMNARSRLVLLRGETISADLRVTRALGAPAVLGGVVFIPHNRVHLSALSAEGQELARVRVQHDVASYAFSQDGDVYFGQRTMTLLEGATTEAQPTLLKLELAHKLPGSPALLPDTNAPPPAPESALHRVSIALAPTRDGRSLGLRDETLYLAFYRLLFGLRRDAAAAHWVHEAASDLVGIRAVAGGVIAVESRGAVLQFDRKGRLVAETQLGLKPLAANIRADRLLGPEPAREPEPVALQLERAVQSGDTRLVPARAFAATLLAGIEDDQAARALISACSDAELPERVREASCEALVQRARPSEALLAALDTHPDYLAQRPQPPVAALAAAAAGGGDQRAVAPLLAHLESPFSSNDDLTAIVEALGRLRDPSSATRLAAFIRLYHADVPDEPFESVLAHAMQVLAQLDRERARPVLEPIAHDVLARPGVRAAAERTLATLPRAESAEDASAAPVLESSTDADSASAPVESAPEGPPVHLTTRHVDEALAPVRVQLARCVRDAPDHPPSARLVLIIDGEGALEDVKTLPESVHACVAPLVRSAKFPATKYGRRSVMSYVVGR